MEDKDAKVREVALHCVGIITGRVGDDAMQSYLKDANPQKMAKINEGKAEVKPSKYDRPENYKPPAKKPAKKVADDDDDDAMNVEMTKPKKAPPKGIGVKPPSKKKKAEDEEMKDETKTPAKAPAKKPALGSAKPAATKAPTKGPSAPVVQDEDLGNGLSPEEAADKVEANFSASIVKDFSSAKWQTKKEAFEKLREEIVEKQPTPDVLEGVAKFVKTQMKDWKESNINLQKEIVNLFNCLASETERINKRTFQCAMSFFVDKIGDVKLSGQIKPMLLTAAEKLSPNFIAL